MRLCPDCGEAKPLEEFPRNKSGRDGRLSYCKPCHNLRGQETRQRLYGGSRHYHLLRRYGIGAADVEGMIAEQGGVCAICREGRRSTSTTATRRASSEESSASTAMGDSGSSGTV